MLYCNYAISPWYTCMPDQIQDMLLWQHFSLLYYTDEVLESQITNVLDEDRARTQSRPCSGRTSGLRGTLQSRQQQDNNLSL